VSEQKYVLDTMVVSALRLPARNPEVAAWAAAKALTSLYVATPTFAEIKRGILRLQQVDPGAAARIGNWFEHNVLAAFATRTLDFDTKAALRLATYPVPDRAPLNDALIAAIAESNDMVIATRNVKHFTPLGVQYIDPWHP